VDLPHGRSLLPLVLLPHVVEGVRDKVPLQPFPSLMISIGFMLSRDASLFIIIIFVMSFFMLSLTPKNNQVKSVRAITFFWYLACLGTTVPGMY
jgi:hypothetical protein